jgi:hypothetical protein
MVRTSNGLHTRRVEKRHRERKGILQMNRSQSLGLVCCLGALSLVGCATSANDHYNEFWEKADSKEKTEFVSKKASWYGDNFKIGYYVDLAVSNLRARDLGKANENLKLADEIVDDNFKKDYAGSLAAFSLSEEAAPYAGDPFEQVQIPLLRSLVFAQSKKWENARAMARRTNDTIQGITQKIAKKHGFKAVEGDSPAAKDATGKATAKPIKWHYVKDAFAYYVAGAAAFNEGDMENALASARSAMKTYASAVYVDSYLVKEIPEPATRLYCHLAKAIDKGVVRDADAELVKTRCGSVAPFDPAKGEVVVVVLHGRAASKQSLNVDIRMDQSIVAKMVAGTAVPLFKAFTASDKEKKDGKSADKDVASGKSSIIYDILLGAMLADDYVSNQIAIQVDELQKKGSKGLGSMLVGGLGALNPEMMRLSVPVYLWHPAPALQQATLGGASSKVMLASNLDGIRDREQFDTMNMSMMRSVSRGIFRVALAEGAGKVGGFWAKFGVGAVAKSSESAESRSLRSLPQAIYTVSASVPPGKLTLAGKGITYVSDEFNVDANKVNFVLAFSGN